MDKDDVRLDSHPNAADCHAIWDAYDVNGTELNALRGDTIGNTVYSGKWVLTTLMALSKIRESGWTKALESDLCTLWDMTAEVDVVMYLVENKFLSIAEATLRDTDEHRLTEILVGIIGNMCSQTAVLPNVGDTSELVEMILLLLRTDDTKTLIQVFRVLQAAVCDVQRNFQSVWLAKLRACPYLGDAVVFVLNSSTNEALLSAAIDFVYVASEVESPENNNFFTGLFKVNKLIAALSESFAQLFPEGPADVHLTCSRVVQNWLTILSNLTKLEIIEVNEEKTDENMANVMSNLSAILRPYKYAWNLAPLNDSAISCIYECLEVVLWFRHHRLPIRAETTAAFATIISRLKYENRNQPATNFHEAELLKYLEDYWLEILDTYDTDEVCAILHAYLEHQVVRNLLNCVQSHPKSSPNQIEKMMQAVSHLDTIHQVTR